MRFAWIFLSTVVVLAAFKPEPQAYVGSGGCRSCHAGIYDSYQKAGMARSFDRIERVPTIEDWTTNNRYYHEASNQHFVMLRSDGKFLQRRYQLDAAGNEINILEREIHYALGSGNKERDYLHRSLSGELAQLPVVWYSQEGRWGIAPGYDNPNHEGFSRKLSYRCVFCHNAYPNLPPGSARYEAMQARFPENLPNGIDCERCHGPGRRHVEDPEPGNIVNPARLSRKLQLDVCMQCHLETSSALAPDMMMKAGRGVFSYRPGEPLENYAVYFDYPAGAGHDDDFNIVHQAYRLRKSACFKDSELTCTTCHNPHQAAENKPAFYNSKCAACHNVSACKAEQSRRAAANDNCISCHMPQRRTGDVIQVTMTDHYIQRKPKANLLAPPRERSGEEYRGDLSFYFSQQANTFDLGMALVQGADVPRGIQLLERTVAMARPRSALPFYHLATAEQRLGRLDRAISDYERALQVDPAFAEAHFNLGTAFMETGNLRQAIASFEEAIRLQPELTDAYVALAAARLRVSPDDLEEARRLNTQALRLDPIHVVAINNLGLIEIRLGRVEAAKSYFRHALAVQPGNQTALENLKKLEGR